MESENIKVVLELAYEDLKDLVEKLDESKDKKSYKKAFKAKKRLQKTIDLLTLI